MANYTNKVDSVIQGLSNFWLEYFKDIDILQKLYQGTEFEIGQSYLELLNLLLNNSLRDTSLFTKDYFKLISFDETDVSFSKGVNANTDRFEVATEDSVRSVPILNNKVLNADASINSGADYTFNDAESLIEFNFDPTNAYKQAFAGSGENGIVVTIRKVPSSLTTLALSASVAYDEPTALIQGTKVQVYLPSSSYTALDAVTAINTSPTVREHVSAAPLTTGEGVFPPVLTSFVAVDSAPLTNFASRVINKQVGGKLEHVGIDSWVQNGVNKGDILKVLSAPGVGKPQNHKIVLHRDNALYVSAETPLRESSQGKVDYVVVREAGHFKSENEPINPSAQLLPTAGASGTVDPVNKRFTYSNPGVFRPILEGDIVELNGVYNIGYYSILEVEDDQNVILAATDLVAESGIDWSLWSAVDWFVLGLSGTVVNNGDGTATLTESGAGFTSDHLGLPLRVNNAGEIETYLIVEVVNSDEVTLQVDDVSHSFTGSPTDWAVVSYVAPPSTVVFSPSVGWPKSETLKVSAQRELDGAPVKEGRDYTFTEKTGKLVPLTPWRPDIYPTAEYEYDEIVYDNLTALQSGSDGTITPGDPNTFSSPTASFTSEHVGYALSISGSGHTGTTNNGVHFIAKVVSPTQVELTDDKVVNSAVDPNNGSLGWELLHRGTLDVSAISETVSELAFWAPDALIDHYHLYYTYGYLINKFERSSEEYRALIRGLFQLFMLGPTLERFESAMNTAAGLPVIQSDGEILLDYNSNTIDSGNDGDLDFTNRTFESPSATFSREDQGKYILITGGVNRDKPFQIEEVLTSNKVRLVSSPLTDSSVNWELTDLLDQEIKTNKRTYTYPRLVPIRGKFKDSSNFGVLELRAFEVVSDVFKVTDYIESPRWFDISTIPETLFPDADVGRRQVSPQLFENVVDPADDARIGDPGLYVGADSEGSLNPAQLLRDDAGALDGALTGDMLYPFQNTEVFFESATANFSSADLGSFVVVNPGTSNEETYEIAQILSSTKVKILSDKDVEDSTGLDWEIVTKPLPKRHKAAFVIVNEYLKHHLVSVEFDAALLELLPSDIISDLQELVFIAKPAYTYLILTPGTLFEELLEITEDLSRDATYNLGGTSGESIYAAGEPLRISGESWTLGSWYRLYSFSGSFSTPTSAVTVTGPADAGYNHPVIRWAPDFSAFTSSGDPIHPSDLVFKDHTTFSNSLDLSASGSEVTVTAPAGSFDLDSDVFAHIEITGSAASNDGVFRIGKVIDDQTVAIHNPLGSSETNLSGTLKTAGSQAGKLYNADQGITYFEVINGRHTFDASDVGTFIRKTVPTPSNVTTLLEIVEVMDSSTVRVGKVRRVSPNTGDDNIGVTIVDGVATCDTPGEFIFSKDMANLDRAESTANQKVYYLQRMGGTVSSTVVESYKILRYINANQVEVEGVSNAVISASIRVEEHEDVVTETPSWEHVNDQFSYNDPAPGKVTLDTPTQDTDTVSYDSVGVRIPVDPTSEVFDDTQGDVYYTVGMSDPKRARTKIRTGRDVDLLEDPVKIVVTNI